VRVSPGEELLPEALQAKPGAQRHNPDGSTN
jgi:hypothetical protein